MMRSLPLLLLVGCGLVGCGPSVAPLTAFDVVRAPSVDCTVTGSTSRDCVDDQTLSQQRSRGRWVLEAQPNESFTLTTEDGDTLPGIFFTDDAFVLNEPPCVGEGGVCFFARRKFQSVDDRNNGCTRFGELVAILRRIDDGTFTGILGDQSGTSEECGTSTIVQRIDNVTGTPSPEPALARAELLE